MYPMFGHGVYCLKTRSPTLEFVVTVSVDVMVVVEAEGRAGVTVSVRVTREVSVTVLVASPTAMNTLAEISTPAVTIAAAIMR
jgi:hypothetical protein